MGVNIFNLSETINIQFSNVNMVRDAKHFQNNLLLDTIRVQMFLRLSHYRLDGVFLAFHGMGEVTSQVSSRVFDLKEEKFDLF